MFQASSTLSRRKFIRTTTAAFAAGALGTSVEMNAAVKRAGETFTFVVASDLHYRDHRCRPWFQRVVAHIRALQPRPAFVVLAGDLSEDGTREQLIPVRRLFATLPMPVHNIIGNHDYTLEGDRRPFESLYGEQMNYAFAHRHWQFLALDTTQGRSVYRTRIPGATFEWVERTLERVPHEQPIILLTHFPLHRNWLRPLNARRLLERFRQHNVLAGFSGHWHGLTQRDERGVELSTGRCCSWWRHNHDGSDAKGYTLCRVSGTEVERSFVAVT